MNFPVSFQAGSMAMLERRPILSLVVIISLLKLSITYKITRPRNDNWEGDEYDLGKFVYRDQLVSVIGCATSISSSRCRCPGKGTFLFNTSSTGIVNNGICIGDYGLEDLGCMFRFDIGNNYVKVASKQSRIGDVKLGYNVVNQIDLLNVSSWNMTWIGIPSQIFKVQSKTFIEWEGNATERLRQFAGVLFKFELEARGGSVRTKSCLLLKVPGIGHYPLSPYVARKSSDVMKPSTQLVKMTATELRILSSASTTAAATTPISSSYIVASSEVTSAIKGGLISTSYRASWEDRTVCTQCSTGASGLFFSKSKSARSKLGDLTSISAKLVPIESVSGPLYVTPSASVIPERRDTSKADVTTIVGASVGGSLLVILVIVVVLLLRRQQCSSQMIWDSKDSKRVNLISENAHAAENRNGNGLGKLENPVYGENVRFDSVVGRKGLAIELCSYAYENTTNAREDDKTIYQEVGGEYQTIDAGALDKPDIYQGLDFTQLKEGEPAEDSSNAPVYHEIERPGSDRTKTASPVYHTVQRDLYDEPERIEGVTTDGPIYREVEAGQ